MNGERTGSDYVKQPSSGTRFGTPENENRESFAIGRVFDHRFFKKSRFYLPGNRGPYRCTKEWITAVIQFQLRWIKNGPVEDDDDYGSDFEEEVPEMELYCNKFLEVLPHVFANEEAELPYTLHHHDLNASNVIVNPETFEIVGTVDWEMVNIVPLWRAAAYPEFLDYERRRSDEIRTPPNLETYGPCEENQVDIIVERRDRWDYQILRDHWDATMKRLTKDDEVLLDPSEVETKIRYLYEITSLTNMWNWARIWLYRFETETNDLPPDDGTVQKLIEKRRQIHLNNLNKDTGSSEIVLAGPETVDDLAVTSSPVCPVPVDADALTEEKGNLMEAERPTSPNISEVSADQDRSIDTAAQTAEQGAPLVIATEPQLANGLIHSDQLTKEEASPRKKPARQPAPRPSQAGRRHPSRTQSTR